MIPKFKSESLHSPMSVEYRFPTRVENDVQLDGYTEYLKDIGQGEGLGSITDSDLDIFYHLLENPQRFDKEKLQNLFGLLSHLASAERFENRETAQECMNMIETYRTELDL